MALIGNIEHFKGNAEEFESYLERVEHLFKVNVVSEDMKVSMFITLAGPNVYQTLKNLVAPNKPNDMTYQEVITMLSKHYSPPVSEIHERYVFNKCNQSVDQTIAEYIVELRKLASTCNFKQFLDEALRDRFVCGIRSENIQRRLLSETKLTFGNACQLAQAAELAEKQVKTLTDGYGKGGQVNYVNRRPFGSQGNQPQRAKFNDKASGSGKEAYYNNNAGNKNYANSSSSSSGFNCKKCGRKHDKNKCPAVKWKCYACGKFGHVKKLCPLKHNVNSTVATLDETEESDGGVNDDLLSLHNISNSSVVPYRISLKVGSTLVPFEIDTGACKSVISLLRFKRVLNLPLKPVKYKLNVISGHDIKAVGECSVNVEHGGGMYSLVLTVVDSSNDFVPLLGRNWLNVLFPNWQSSFAVNQVEVNNSLISEYKQKYPNVFDPNLCTPIREFEVKFAVKEGIVPVVKKAYSMAYALQPKVEQKLKQMVAVGILKPVTHSEWASPIVVVPKKDGDVRICSDFRLTVNKVLNVDQYPLPRPDDIFADLAGGVIFSVLDLSGAYQQLRVHPDFQKFLTINTHIGLFQFTRLTYGISSAPAIFQSVMDQILGGIAGVKCYLDDILISSKTMEEAKKVLREVLERLNKFNVKVKVAKCKFFKQEVEYLGHRIDHEGIHPSKEKIRAIKQAPEPENLTQLRAYLGLLNYYAKFVPMLSSQLKPLYDLLKSNVEFRFDEKCRKAFDLSKRLISENKVLVHYDPSKEIVIVCDASSYGVGGVLCHRVDGRERPVMFVSGTLSKAEQNYSQLEREALAIIFCVKKFHKYIYGRSFTLVSDHQPLRVIFNPNRNISVMSASRIIRWNVILSAYDYQIEYRKGKQLYEADMLSRLPLQEPTEVDSSVNSFRMTNELPLSFQDIAKATGKDSVLVRVKEYVRTGWPDRVSGEELKPYYTKRNELSLEEGCIMLGCKVVIPAALRKSILELLHEDHVGIVRTKMMARSVCWWPGLQSDIEVLVNSCHVCQVSQNNYEKCLVSWPKTENLFQRVHVDFFHLNGNTCLLLVDSKSRWIDIHCMSKGTNVTQTIEKLRLTFSMIGLPETIVSDNGPPFGSNEFIKFCHVNGIKILKSPPYHPQSNGIAERHVQTIKSSLKKYCLQKVSLSFEQQIVHFLFNYRNTPCTSTGVSPNEMLFKVKPRTLMDLLKPKKGSRVEFRKTEDFVKHMTFEVGEKVWIGKLGPLVSVKWQLGTILRIVSAVTYLVKIDDKILYKHVNNLRKYYSSIEDQTLPQSQNPVVSCSITNQQSYVVSESQTNMVPQEVLDVSDNQKLESLPGSASCETQPDPSADLTTGSSSTRSPQINVRRSNRPRKPTQRLNL